VVDDQPRESNDDAEEDVSHDLDDCTRNAELIEQTSEPAALRLFILPLEQRAEPLLQARPQAARLLTGIARCSENAFQSLHFERARRGSRCQLALHRGAQLGEAARREIVARLFPTARQPFGPPALFERAREIGTSRGDSLVSHIESRIESR